VFDLPGKAERGRVLAKTFCASKICNSPEAGVPIILINDFLKNFVNKNNHAGFFAGFQCDCAASRF
jgi:hypothetical protein